ncbi:hypothetical protein MMC30_000586 [Trapelia coarctata]|nr:hypothetical protein [Trapelia coarctata]
MADYKALYEAEVKRGELQKRRIEELEFEKFQALQREIEDKTKMEAVLAKLDQLQANQEFIQTHYVTKAEHETLKAEHGALEADHGALEDSLKANYVTKAEHEALRRDVAGIGNRESMRALVRYTAMLQVRDGVVYFSGTRGRLRRETWDYIKSYLKYHNGLAHMKDFDSLLATLESEQPRLCQKWVRYYYPAAATWSVEEFINSVFAVASQDQARYLGISNHADFCTLI